jgi:OFA family oxalate/formate antiporter-like MFS transporter
MNSIMRRLPVDGDVNFRSEWRLSRWWLIVIAVLGMGATGTYQFSWSSIRIPLGARVGAGETALGTVFTLYVIFQTLSQFPAGWVRDRFGPRPPLAAGAVLMAAGYAGAAFAPNVAALYVAYALGGVGAGAVYTVMINTPVKWFDERRGLATGIVGAAYAGTSFVFIIFIREWIDVTFVGTLLGVAAAVGLLALAGVPFIRDPGDGEGAGAKAERTGASDDADSDPQLGTDGRSDPQSGTDGGADPHPEADGGSDSHPEADGGSDSHPETDGGSDSLSESSGSTHGDPVGYTWRETVRTWQFWLLYAVFVIVNGVGLMIIGKIVAYAEAMALPAAAATGAASLVALSDGAGVAVGGTLSDRIGRERTVVLSLVVCGICLAGASLVAIEGLGTAFVGLIAVAAFFRSPIFSVFPSLVGDYYGTNHSSENYAALYSGKLWGGVVGGTVTSGLVVSLGWNPTFQLGAGLLVLAGVATAFLRPVEPNPH